MENRSTDHLAHWLSEYPNQRGFITHPDRVRWFSSNPCPVATHEDEAWNQIVSRFRE